GDVGAQIARLVPAERGHRGGTLVVVDVEQDNPAAAGDQVFGHGQAETGHAAGNNRADVGQLHGASRIGEPYILTGSGSGDSAVGRRHGGVVAPLRGDAVL